MPPSSRHDAGRTPRLIAAQGRCRAAVIRAFQQFNRVDCALAPKELNDRDGDRTFYVRQDVDLGALPLVTGVPLGDCLGPWLQDGDTVLLDQRARNMESGEIVAVRYADKSGLSDGGFLKVLREFDGRWFFLSRDIPLPLDDYLVVCGAVVSFMHYAKPTERPPEVQAGFDRDNREAQSLGLAWNAQYLNSINFPL